MVDQVAVVEQIQLIHTQAELVELAPQDKETTVAPELQALLHPVVAVDQEAPVVMPQPELVVLEVQEPHPQSQDQVLPGLVVAVEVVAQNMEVVVVLVLVVAEMVQVRHPILPLEMQQQQTLVAVAVQLIMAQVVLVVQVSWSSAIPMSTQMQPAPQDRPHFPTPAVSRYIPGLATVR